jgi:hypothetical protein
MTSTADFSLKPNGSGIYLMKKTSADHHWTLVTSVTGEGHRVLYVKIFGRLPDAPIKVKFKIYDDTGKTVCLTAYVDACCAVDTVKDILKSGNYLLLAEDQLIKWNGGNELNEKGSLKNIRLSVSFGD